MLLPSKFYGKAATATSRANSSSSRGVPPPAAGPTSGALPQGRHRGADAAATFSPSLSSSSYFSGAAGSGAGVGSGFPHSFASPNSARGGGMALSSPQKYPHHHQSLAASSSPQHAPRGSLSERHSASVLQRHAAVGGGGGALAPAASLHGGHTSSALYPQQGLSGGASSARIGVGQRTSSSSRPLSAASAASASAGAHLGITPSTATGSMRSLRDELIAATRAVEAEHERGFLTGGGGIGMGRGTAASSSDASFSRPPQKRTPSSAQLLSRTPLPPPPASTAALAAAGRNGTPQQQRRGGSSRDEEAEADSDADAYRRPQQSPPSAHNNGHGFGRQHSSAGSGHLLGGHAQGDASISPPRRYGGGEGAFGGSHSPHTSPHRRGSPTPSSAHSSPRNSPRGGSSAPIRMEHAFDRNASASSVSSHQNRLLPSSSVHVGLGQQGQGRGAASSSSGLNHSLTASHQLAAGGRSLQTSSSLQQQPPRPLAAVPISLVRGQQAWPEQSQMVFVGGGSASVVPSAVRKPATPSLSSAQQQQQQQRSGGSSVRFADGSSPSKAPPSSSSSPPPAAERSQQRRHRDASMYDDSEAGGGSVPRSGRGGDNSSIHADAVDRAAEADSPQRRRDRSVLLPSSQVVYSSVMPLPPTATSALSTSTAHDGNFGPRGGDDAANRSIYLSPSEKGSPRHHASVLSHTTANKPPSSSSPSSSSPRFDDDEPPAYNDADEGDDYDTDVPPPADFDDDDNDADGDDIHGYNGYNYDGGLRAGDNAGEEGTTSGGNRRDGDLGGSAGEKEVERQYMYRGDGEDGGNEGRDNAPSSRHKASDEAYGADAEGDVGTAEEGHPASSDSPSGSSGGSALQVFSLIDGAFAYAVTHSPSDTQRLVAWVGGTPEGREFALVDPEELIGTVPPHTSLLPRHQADRVSHASSGKTKESDDDGTIRGVSKKAFLSCVGYLAYHLDYGPTTWFQAFRLGQLLEAARDWAAAFSHSNSNSGGNPSCCSALLVLRAYGDMERYTNLVASLAVLCVQRELIATADHLRKYFPFEEVLSRCLFFHDASPFDDVQSVFDLTVEDVVRGAVRSVGLWGTAVLCDEQSFIEPSETFASLRNGDVSWIIPGESAACSCPIPDEGSAAARAEAEAAGADVSSPSYRPREGQPGAFYAALFGASVDDSFFGGVGAVVQLNAELYNSAALEAAGVRHLHMCYEDGAIPPNAIVDDYLSLMESSRREQKGVVVHCMAGLGRTGTLLCIDLMVNFGFSAREAIGWCRLMRPGMVIGHQQAFLLWYENALRRMRHTRGTISGAGSAPAAESGGGGNPHPASPPSGAAAPAHGGDASQLTPTVTTAQIMHRKAAAAASRGGNHHGTDGGGGGASHPQVQLQPPMPRQEASTYAIDDDDGGEGEEGTSNEKEVAAPVTALPKPRTSAFLAAFLDNDKKEAFDDGVHGVGSLSSADAKGGKHGTFSERPSAPISVALTSSSAVAAALATTPRRISGDYDTGVVGRAGIAADAAEGAADVDAGGDAVMSFINLTPTRGAARDRERLAASAVPSSADERSSSAAPPSAAAAAPASSRRRSGDGERDNAAADATDVTAAVTSHPFHVPSNSSSALQHDTDSPTKGVLDAIRSRAGRLANGGNASTSQPQMSRPPRVTDVSAVTVGGSDDALAAQPEEERSPQHTAATSSAIHMHDDGVHRERSEAAVATISSSAQQPATATSHFAASAALATARIADSMVLDDDGEASAAVRSASSNGHAHHHVISGNPSSGGGGGGLAPLPSAPTLRGGGGSVVGSRRGSAASLMLSAAAAAAATSAEGFLGRSASSANAILTNSANEADVASEVVRTEAAKYTTTVSPSRSGSASRRRLSAERQASQEEEMAAEASPPPAPIRSGSAAEVGTEVAVASDAMYAGSTNAYSAAVEGASSYSSSALPAAVSTPIRFSRGAFEEEGRSSAAAFAASPATVWAKGPPSATDTSGGEVSNGGSGQWRQPQPPEMYGERGNGHTTAYGAAVGAVGFGADDDGAAYPPTRSAAPTYRDEAASIGLAKPHYRYAAASAAAANTTSDTTAGPTDFRPDASSTVVPQQQSRHTFSYGNGSRDAAALATAARNDEEEHAFPVYNPDPSALQRAVSIAGGSGVRLSRTVSSTTTTTALPTTAASAIMASGGDNRSLSPPSQQHYHGHASHQNQPSTSGFSRNNSITTSSVVYPTSHSTHVAAKEGLAGQQQQQQRPPHRFTYSYASSAAGGGGGGGGLSAADGGAVTAASAADGGGGGGPATDAAAAAAEANNSFRVEYAAAAPSSAFHSPQRGETAPAPPSGAPPPLMGSPSFALPPPPPPTAPPPPLPTVEGVGYTQSHVERDDAPLTHNHNRHYGTGNSGGGGGGKVVAGGSIGQPLHQSFGGLNANGRDAPARSGVGSRPPQQQKRVFTLSLDDD